MSTRIVRVATISAGLILAAGVLVLARPAQVPQRGAGRGAAPSGPPPRDAQGRADLSGMWMSGGAPGGARSDAVPYDAKALAKIEEFRKRQNIDDPNGLCLLPGIPRIYQMPMPFKIIQLPNEVIFVHEAFRGIRVVPTDGRPHPDDADPAYMGDSVGHWEGDTLVIDIKSFNDRTWLGYGAVHHSDKLQITERITRTGPEAISYEATITDPGVFTKPWTVRSGFALRPNERIREYECGENNLEVVKFQKLLEKPELLAPTQPATQPQRGRGQE